MFFIFRLLEKMEYFKLMLNSRGKKGNYKEFGIINFYVFLVWKILIQLFNLD